MTVYTIQKRKAHGKVWRSKSRTIRANTPREAVSAYMNRRLPKGASTARTQSGDTIRAKNLS